MRRLPAFALAALLCQPVHAQQVIGGGGGGGGVPSVATACPASAAVTTAVTLNGVILPSSMSAATYSPANTNNYDCGLTITFTAAVAITLPQAASGGFLQNGWHVRYVCQLGCSVTTTTSTFSPPGGAVSVLNIPAGFAADLETDGVNYYDQVHSNFGAGGQAIAVNFNSANTDNAITIYAPTSNYRITDVTIANASASISTATWGLFSATGGTGTAIFAAGQTITVTASAANTANNMMVSAPATTESFNFTTLQFRIGTAQGTAATADVIIHIQPLP